MIDSPHLCPAAPFALHSDNDRFDTEHGPLFHACRYLASNQVAVDTTRFGQGVYEDAEAFYRVFVKALDRYPAPPADAATGEWPIQRVHRIIAGIVPLARRAAALRADLNLPEAGWCAS